MIFLGIVLLYFAKVDSSQYAVPLYRLPQCEDYTLKKQGKNKSKNLGYIDLVQLESVFKVCV